MDPLSLIGGIQATAGIVSGCVYMIQQLVELRSKYKSADTTISLLAGEVRAVKAAVTQIEEWYKFEIEPKQAERRRREREGDVEEEERSPGELVDSFKITFEGCRLAMDTLIEEVDNLCTKNPFMKRMGYIWNEGTMQDFAMRLRHQVNALQLLASSVKLNIGSQQVALLQKPGNRKIIDQITDDTSTLKASRMGSRYDGSDTATVRDRMETITISEHEPELESVPEVEIPSPIPTRSQPSVPIDNNPFRRSRDRIQLPVETSYASKRRSTNPFLNRSASAATTQSNISGISSSMFESIADSGYHSAFYDEDADIVTTSYRERREQMKSEHTPSIARSASAPTAKGRDNSPGTNTGMDTPTPTPTPLPRAEVRMPPPIVNLPPQEPDMSPMERFQRERHVTTPSMYDPMESHMQRPMRIHTVSDPVVPQTHNLTSPTTKISSWAPIKQFTIRRKSKRERTEAVALKPSTMNLRAARTVKRKSEGNIHQSIDFSSEDGLETPAIVRAAQSASRIEVIQLLEQRVDIEAKHLGSGRTALAVAAHCGNGAVVEILLHNGAKTEAKDLSGMTPLHLAASRGHYRVAESLIIHHANVEAQEFVNDKTPLRFACDGGHLEVVQLLLEHRAKANARDKELLTSLHAAAKIGDVEIVDLLIKNGADFEMKDATPMTAMHYAARGDYDAVVDKLLSYKADIESRGEKGMSPLSCACAAGSLQTAKLLINKRANWRQKADGDMTPLHFAAMYDQVDTADLLLQQKRINVDARNNEYRTPLHLAVRHKSFSTTELLVRKRADVEAVCKDQLRPLHYACDSGNEAITRFLLGNGAQVEAMTSLGWRPIHFAAYRGYVPVVRALKEKGVQLDARDPHGDRALCTACVQGHTTLVAFLLDNGSAMRMRVPKGPSLEDNPLCRAARHGRVNIVQELILRKASVFQRDEVNWQPLRYAVHYGHPSVVEALLRAGAPIDDGQPTNPGSPSATKSIWEKWGFAEEVDSREKVRIRELLSTAEESLMPRRMNEYDPYLTAPAPSTIGTMSSMNERAEVPASVLPTFAGPASVAREDSSRPQVYFELPGL